MKIPFRRLLPALLLAAGAGCSSTYYHTLEKLGHPKRDLLVERVTRTEQAQTSAKEQFTSALDRFIAVTQYQGGDLEQKYDELNREYERCQGRAKDVREHIASVEDVANELFREWRKELGDYSNASLRQQSDRELTDTQRNYDHLVGLMHRAADRMDPVLANFHDQVLFLKHNLNARAIASLDTTNRNLQGDIQRLISDMEASIRESENFIRNMRASPGGAPAS